MGRVDGWEGRAVSPSHLHSPSVEDLQAGVRQPQPGDPGYVGSLVDYTIPKCMDWCELVHWDPALTPSQRTGLDLVLVTTLDPDYGKIWSYCPRFSRGGDVLLS